MNEECDYVVLSSLFARYSNPRDKISRLLKSGDLVRIKKGIYVFGPRAARRPYSVETLANLIYGPSVISLEYALSWHGMIPEKTTEVTSVTTLRNKAFSTPAGRFSYAHQHPSLFAEGCDLVAIDPTHTILIATREKALVDRLTLSRSLPEIKTAAEMREFLSLNMRIEDARLRALDLARIRRLERIHRRRIVTLLRETIKEYQEENHA
jgi:predicted transcriptional regulator of viral defense system